MYDINQRDERLALKIDNNQDIENHLYQNQYSHYCIEGLS